MLTESEYKGTTNICLERARYLTESFKATDGEPMVIRRAKAIRHILENMTIYIQPGELIVGNFASTPQSLPLYPDIYTLWLDKAINNSFKNMLDEEGKKEWREIYDYWKVRSAWERAGSLFPESLKPYTGFNGVQFAIPTGVRQPDIIDFEKVFKQGLNGRVDRIKARLDKLKVDIGDMSGKNYVEQRDTLEAMLIALDGGMNFARRYADLARKLAEEQKNAKRKKELERIADICDWVPANPPRTLYEAMQCYLLINIIVKQIEISGQGQGDRLDLLLNPFYQRDKAEGRITRDEAQQLMECLDIKLAERGHLNPPEVAAVYAGISDVKDINIGGVTPEGDDATNEFSFIILDAAGSVMLPEPTVAFRYHPKINPELVDKAIDLLRTGIGYPSFYNDAAVVPFLMSRGHSLKEARNYGITACVSPDIPGKNTRTCWVIGGDFNLMSCLELVLYQGVSKFTGMQIGAKTPDTKTFTCIEDVMEAYLEQVDFFVEKVSRLNDIGQEVLEERLHRPFSSALLDGCIERGKDCILWSEDSYIIHEHCGTTNIADSLAAIKKFVFDDKVVTMEELVEACRNNWEGRENLRQRIINEAPKFGNDDDYVDLLAREVHIRSNEVFMKYKDKFGFPHCLDGSIAGGYYGLSVASGATPDGRKDHDPSADTVISPMAGRDKNGPTAVIKSTGKITPTYAHLFNQKFMPQFLEGENKRIFAQYLKTWVDLGNWHVQFNVVDRSTLLDAQIHPEKYPDLLVRVAGYSAYFVDLSKGVQDDIIRRCEQRF
jgi:formate C-acetyltransferase